MSTPSTSDLSVELLLRVIDVKYGYFTLPKKWAEGILKRNLVRFYFAFRLLYSTYYAKLKYSLVAGYTQGSFDFKVE